MKASSPHCPLFYLAALCVRDEPVLFYSGDIGGGSMYTPEDDLAKRFNDEEEAEAVCRRDRGQFERAPSVALQVIPLD